MRSAWFGAFVVAACSSNSPMLVDAPGSADASGIDAAPNDPMLQGAYTYIKASNAGAGDQFGGSVALSADGNTLAVGASLEDSAGTEADNSTNDAGAVYVFVRSGGSWVQQAYVKASNPDVVDHFGRALALSADGNTLAVGAENEAGCARTINAPPTNNCFGAGAVYVFVRANGAWTQQAYVKTSNARPQQYFGFAVALSADGNTLAASQVADASNAAGIDGNQFDSSMDQAGSVVVFTRSGAAWSQQAYIKASNPDVRDEFGFHLALSATGDVLGVGAINEASSATGVDGSQLDNGRSEAGAVYVFRRASARWSQEAYVKASNPDPRDHFGFSVALSWSGNTLAVGATGESSGATGAGGDQSDNTQLGAGAVYVFVRSGGVWAQQAYLKEDRSNSNDTLGTAVALSADGNLLAAGAATEEGGGTGITTVGTSVLDQSGAVYMFRRTGTSWARQHYIKASNTGAADLFGHALSLSGTGGTLVVGGSLEDSAATGIGGDQASNASADSGAAYVIE